MLINVAPEHVTLGMFIHGFKGSWFNHPFWRARFVVADMAVLDHIRTSKVDFVVIDDAKGEAPPVAGTSASKRPSATPARSIAHKPEPAPERQRNAEVERARKIISRGKMLVKRLLDDARLGRVTVSADILELVDDISKSLERSQSTLINMARLKNRDEYTYLHSVAVCALMIGLARQLGMPEATVRDMGIAGLYHDVGKAVISLDLLNKPGSLSDEEFAQVKAHTLAGEQLLRTCDDVPPVALDVALHHHERMDGTGYPYGLNSATLSLAARMGAICDIYDALTSDRAYKDAWAPSEAIAKMDSWEGHLDRDLLFTFMQSIGLFPAGMLVRLRSNQLAIILPNGRRGSRARARAFYAIPDSCFVAAQDVPLREERGCDHAVNREDPLHWPLPLWSEFSARLLTGAYRPRDGQSYIAA